MGRPSREIAHGSQFSQTMLTDYILAHAGQTFIDMSPAKIGRWLVNRDIAMTNALPRAERDGIVSYDISRVEKVTETFDAHVNAWREAEKARVAKILAPKVGRENNLPLPEYKGGWEKPVVIFNKPKRGGFFKAQGSGQVSQKAEISKLFEAFAKGRISANALAEGVAKIRSAK